MNTAIYSKVKRSFEMHFGRKPEIIVYSPGRINLIGEHTDYNKGFAFPAAINRGIYFAIAECKTPSEIVAKDLNDSFSFKVDNIQPQTKKWANYLLGVSYKIQQEKKLANHQILFMSDIPVGAGLSSSAALTCGYAFALNHIFKLNYTKLDLALIAQWSEHNFANVNCGLMDQLANLFGKKDHMLFVDFKTHQVQPIKWDMKNYSLVLFDSGVSHQLANTEYNIRRQQCHDMVGSFQKLDPEIKSLRDVSKENLQQIRSLVGEDEFRRAKFIVEENLRVQATFESIHQNEIESIGCLLNNSHTGLSEDFNVSCEEVDFIQKETNDQEACSGARIMGGGFGGCTLNLIQTKSVKSVFETIHKSYKFSFGNNLKLYEISISDGTKIIE